MKALLIDVCVDRKHVVPAFLARGPGAFTTDWLAADASDIDILTLACNLDRIILTEDTDFGELIFRAQSGRRAWVVWRYQLWPPPRGVSWLSGLIIAGFDRLFRLLPLEFCPRWSAHGPH